MNNFFQKVILLLSLLFPLISPIFSNTSTASAQSELLFGQNHFYTVVFRGNGEAVTYAKIVITNPDERPLTEFSFEIPRVSVTEMAMYQMKLPQECVRYDYSSPERHCLEWLDPDYTQKYYYYGYGYADRQAEYQKIQFTKSGNLYRLTLPTPVGSHKATAIVVAYVAKGYVKGSFGLFKFNFETMKVPSRIEQVRVAVDVDSDLILKGKRARVGYNESPSGLITGSQAALGFSSRDLERVAGAIGLYGSLVKEAKNISPNETFIVRGEYATSWFRLYLRSIIITILVVVSIFVGVRFLTRSLKRRDGQGGQIGQIKDAKDQQTLSQKSQSSVSILDLTNVSVGLLSAGLVIGLTYLLKVLLESDLFRWLNVDIVFVIIGLFMIILLYVLIIFVPAIAVAIKYDWKSFVSILIMEFLWFAVFFILYLVLFRSGLTSDTPKTLDF